VSGEDGAAGYIFQLNVILQVALELWGSEKESDVEALLVEGKTGQDAVDYTVVAEDGHNRVLSQVKKRRTQRTFSAREILTAIEGLDRAGDDAGSQLEFVTNGRIGPSGLELIDLLNKAPYLDEAQVAECLGNMGVGDLARPTLAESLRRTSVTVRPVPTEQLRSQVADGLSVLRGRFGQPVGREAAELLRSRLFELISSKTDDGTLDRRLTREEFFRAASTPHRMLEIAHGSRWGALIGMADRQHAVRRPALLNAIAELVQDDAGLHGQQQTTTICVLTGTAGVGKTTLAQQYALEHAAEFDIIYQLSVDNSAEPMHSNAVATAEFEQLAGWMNHNGADIVVEDANASELSRSIQATLGSWPRRWMLLIDNVDDYRHVAPFLPATSYGLVLITTRNSTWPTPLPRVFVDRMTKDEATRLLQTHLTPEAGSISLNEVRQLADKLDYYPLALATASAFIARTGETSQQFLNRLTEEAKRVATLAKKRATPADYPVPVVAALKISLRYIEQQAENDNSASLAVAMLHRASMLFADQIPLLLLHNEEFDASEAVSVLRELSLVYRWHDGNNSDDWLRIHRLLQDVIRVELSETGERDRILCLIQRDLTELIYRSCQDHDFAYGSVLRKHGNVVASHVCRYNAGSWSDAVALLSNTATLTATSGEFADAENLYCQAIGIVPNDDTDPRVAIRRAKTLLGYAELLQNQQRYAESRSCLLEADQSVSKHLEQALHSDLMRQINISQLMLDSFNTIDDEQLKLLLSQLDRIDAHSWELRQQKCVTRMKISSRIQWHAGQDRTILARAAEEVLTLEGVTQNIDPRAVAHAHSLIAEYHAGKGEKSAALTHYKTARAILESIEGTEPDIVATEALGLAWAMSGIAFDIKDGRLYPTADSLFEQILQDIDTLLSAHESEGYCCDYLRLRWTFLRIVHFAHHGQTGKVNELIDVLHVQRNECREPIPQITHSLLAHVSGYTELAEQVAVFRQVSQGVHIAPEPLDTGRFDGSPECEHFRYGQLDTNHAYDCAEPTPGMDTQQVWGAAVLHTELLCEWLMNPSEALMHWTEKLWSAPTLREIHVCGALQIMTILLERYTAKTSPEASTSDACAMLESDINNLRCEHGIQGDAALNLLHALGRGEGVIELPPRRLIIGERDLLASILTAESSLLKSVAEGEGIEAADLARRLHAVAEFEAQNNNER
jgi:tetratricopeptide (TPR) repeat protein